MSTKRILLYISIPIVAIVAALAVGAYINEREGRARMEQIVEDQKKVIQESRQAAAENQAKLAETLAQWEKTRASVKTPEQAIKIVHDYAGMAPQIVLPAPTAENPQPAPVLQFPIEQAKILADFTITCKECEVKLGASEVDRRELVRQMQAIEAQRDAAIRTVKGGMFMERLKRNTKWFLLGAAIGAGAVAATK